MPTVDGTNGSESSSWSSRPFRWTFGALTVSMLGSQITALAVPLLAALTLHATPIEMGVLGAASLLPTFVVSLAAGVFVDRVRRKRRLMIAMDIVRAVLLLLIPAAVVVGQLSLPLLYAVVFAVGTATVIHELTQNAFIPAVVAKPQLLDANAKLQMSYSIGESAGPGVGGLLVQIINAPLAVVANAVSYLASGALLARARSTSTPDLSRAPHPVAEVKEGLRALLADPLLGPWVRWGSVSVVFMGAFEAQYVLFASRDLSLSPAWIGVIAAAGGLGAVPAALLITRLERTVPVGKTIVVGLMGYFAFLLAVPATHGPQPLVVATLVLAKIAQTLTFTISNVQQWSLRQLTTSPQLLGRVAAGNRFLIGAAETAGALTSGIAVELLGARPSLALCGVLGILALAPLIRRPLWSLKRLPTHPA